MKPAPESLEDKSVFETLVQVCTNLPTIVSGYILKFIVLRFARLLSQPFLGQFKGVRMLRRERGRILSKLEGLSAK